MIRRWIKNIIKETMLENMSPCNITVIESEDSDIKLKINGGIFVDSKIHLSKKDNLSIEGSEIRMNEGTFINMD